MGNVYSYVCMYVSIVYSSLINYLTKKYRYYKNIFGILIFLGIGSIIVTSLFYGCTILCICTLNTVIPFSISKHEHQRYISHLLAMKSFLFFCFKQNSHIFSFELFLQYQYQLINLSVAYAKPFLNKTIIVIKQYVFQNLSKI